MAANLLIDTEFIPEDPMAKSVKWVAVKEIKNGEVLFKKEFGGNNRVAYMRTTIISDKEQKISLEMGSDDGIKVWLNGKVVHKLYKSRAHKAGEDKINVTLIDGENNLLVKIIQAGGDWSASVIISSLDGSFAEGVGTVVEP